MSIRQFSKISASLFFAGLLLSCSSTTAPLITPLISGVAPTVLMVVPETDGIGTNRQVSVAFSTAMDPSSINTNSFTIAGAKGTVLYDATNKIASFKASPNFTANTTYNATITTAAKDAKGTPLAAPFDFSFTTRATPDTSAPYIVAVNLAPGATCVPLSQEILITFNEQMSSSTINPMTVFINGVVSTVTYDVLTQTATLLPVEPLSPNTTYTLTVTAGAKDQGGVALSPTLSQTFSTCGVQSGGTQPVALCPYIGNFTVLAGSTVTNTGSSVITGDVGVSPGTAVTGFPPGLTSGAIHRADAAAAKAEATLTAGYNDAAGRSGGTTESGDLTGKTLTAGVYKSTSSLAITGNLTLDAQGNPNAVFIFQVGSTLTTGSGSRIILTNGASACNVFWQIGSSATLGTSSVFKGNILALTSITVTTGADVQGRLLARNGAVTLDSNTLVGCNCTVPLN